MKRKLSIFLILVLFALPVALQAQESTEEPITESSENLTSQADQAEPTPATGQTTYVVQPGDNLYRIALRFGTTTRILAEANNITNAATIFVGQELIIPGDNEQPPSAPTATPAPVDNITPAPPANPSQTTYTVRPGDSLYQIAIRNNTTVAELIAANSLANPNVIFSGQVLIIPGADSGTTTPSTPAPPNAETTTGDGTLEDAGFAYSIEVHFGNQDTAALITLIEQLGMSWVKVRVDWRQLEPEQGQINFDELDDIVSRLEAENLNILFNVTNAPAWARTSPDENGPPDDLANFQTFITALANNYAGQIAAYEIWDEPNLRRNWNCERRMCDTDYVEMVRIAYNAIKQADANAYVVTAGLAPTRFNDRINAIDDRLFLATLYDRGIADISDAIGAHPGGWANPPDARCCEQPSGVESHYESDSFYFLENLAGYHEIMIEYGDTSTPIWITKFGWGTSEDTDPPGQINEFVTYTSLGEQALYVPRAFELGETLGYIGPMFLDNLNGCQGAPGRAEVCYTSLIAPDGTPRPVFDTVRDIEKPSNTTAGDDATGEITDEPTDDTGSAIEPVPLEPEATEEPS